jgi:penicillin-binding protein 1C
MTARRVLRAVVRAFLAVASLSAVAVAALVLTAVRTPLPAALAGQPVLSSLEIGDRDGKLIREVRTEGAMLAREVRLGDLSRDVVPALLAAEDARFFEHVGVDPIAVARAGFQAIWEHHLVSGASTLTQQLARAVVLRPRTLRGKLREMALALRIEASLSKTRILEEYLSRVEFGPGVRGIDAASRWYFDKSPSELSLAESAALVGIPRGPSLYDPRRGLVALTRRRDRILRRMQRRKLSDDVAVERALATPIVLQPHFAEGGVEHLALGLARGTIPSGLGQASGETYRRIDTTLDAPLQREVEVLSRRAAREVLAHDATALAAIVVDNATGDVLAYVGSPDYFEPAHGGANDGVRALRQPGSALKPFVYAAAMERLGMTAATLLPDVDLTLQTAEGPYRPKNYDGRTHGPVRLREALASSLNVPAVLTAEKTGPGAVLSLLRRAGFASLEGSAAHYGAAIALGDGEVRLEELAGAYAMLARGGERVPLSLVRRAWTTRGVLVTPQHPAASRVMDGRTASVLTDVLSDAAARASAFGRGNALELPFPVAAKTGTSKGYRDNWTVGFTHEVTVAVWVGNFDGTPMTGSTGVTGAGPLFHDVMLAAMRGRTPAPLVDTSGLVDVEVCALSGEKPGPGCTHRTHELFRPREVPGTVCSMHVTMRVDPSNDLLATSACANAVERTFEVYPPRYAAWAESAHRPVVPAAYSPRCPGRPSVSEVATQFATVRFPDDGATFTLDPAAHEHPEIVLAARPGTAGAAVRFVLDGRALGVVGAPFELPWRLVPGRHRLLAETVETGGRSGQRAGEKAEGVTFEVADSR